VALNSSVGHHVAVERGGFSVAVLQPPTVVRRHLVETLRAVHDLVVKDIFCSGRSGLPAAKHACSWPGIGNARRVSPYAEPLREAVNYAKLCMPRRT
jgi:hypothetical protein